MPEMNLDDLQDDLISDSDLTLEVVDAPFIDHEEEQDDINLYDMAPDIYTNPHTEEGVDSSSPEGSLNPSIEESDLITDLLRSKGIEDPTQINYEDDDGLIEKINFYSLPYKEQLEILRSNDADIDYGLNDTEVEAISFLRDNNVSLQEAVEYFQRRAVEDYIDNQSITGMEVDQYSNEELYVMHLKSEYPDLTDEEIGIALEKQQEHPDLFRKQVDKLRTNYKQIEQQQITDAQLESEQIEESKRKELEDTLIDVATNIKDIGGLTLDDDDRNAVLDYILSKDVQGISPFIKSLNSPERLFQLAWFAVKGGEAFNIIHDYYKKEITQVSKQSKQSVASTTIPGIKQPKLAYTRKGNAPSQPTTRSNPSTEGMSINDITID